MPTNDDKFLRRAIQLAMARRGHVEPNPMVGCVLVRDGRIIGEGYHTHFGGPHAEPTALANCTESPAGATAYVTLEPCCHTNKKTPPCAPRLIEAKIARVVLGCLDPNPAVNGNGVRMLREAGTTVDGPILEAECQQLIAPFLARVYFQRPYVTLKWAETADGKIAGPGGARRQISNAISSHAVHDLRGRCDAIAVGVRTVITDDPELTSRGSAPLRVPRRVIFDSSLRIPLTSKIVQTARTTKTTVFTITEPGDRSRRLEDLGVHVEQAEPTAIGRLSLKSVLNKLDDVTHLLVEPGPTLAAAFFEENIADQLWVFRSQDRLDDATAPPAAAIPENFKMGGELRLGNDVLTEYLNTRSPVFYALAESADLILSSPLAASRINRH